MWHRKHHPLILTERFWQVQTLLEKYLAGPEQDVRITSTDRDNLDQLYGRKLYLCRHPACEVNKELGIFSSSAERERHEGSHSRPFLCSHPSCSHGWGKMGFITKSELNKHLRRFHGQPHDTEDNHESDVVNFHFLDCILGDDSDAYPDERLSAIDAQPHKPASLQMLLEESKQKLQQIWVQQGWQKELSIAERGFSLAYL